MFSINQTANDPSNEKSFIATTNIRSKFMHFYFDPHWHSRKKTQHNEFENFYVPQNTSGELVTIEWTLSDT